MFTKRFLAVFVVTVAETLADRLVDTKLISQYQLHPSGFLNAHRVSVRATTASASVTTNIKY